MNSKKPILFLICGLFAIGLGCGLALWGRLVAGLTPLAVAMILLGSAILIVWVRSEQPAHATPASEAENDVPKGLPPLPGIWYPYALLGIGAALMIWLLVWTKIIR